MRGTYHPTRCWVYCRTQDKHSCIILLANLLVYCTFLLPCPESKFSLGLGYDLPCDPSEYFHLSFNLDCTRSLIYLLVSYAIHLPEGVQRAPPAPFSSPSWKGLTEKCTWCSTRWENGSHLQVAVGSPFDNTKQSALQQPPGNPPSARPPQLPTLNWLMGGVTTTCSSQQGWCHRC